MKITTTMRTARLIHVETRIEYYKDGSLYNPTHNEKLFWILFGLPIGIEMLEQTFETEIDTFTGKTKKELQAKFDLNMKNNIYGFLPIMEMNHNIELRFTTK